MRILLLLFLIFILSGCNSGDKYQTYILKNLSLSKEDTLIYFTNNTLLSQREIILSGYIDGIATLEIDNGPGGYHKMLLEKDVEEHYISEWYDTKSHIKYTPDSVNNVKSDSIIIKYIVK